MKNDVPELPEIWIQIVSYLSFKDRKNLKLVNAFFYDICSYSVFIKNEEIAIQTHYTAAEVFMVLMKYKLKCLNLRFEGKDMAVDDGFINVWQSCGDKINSLTFNRCWLTNKSLEDVIIYCTKLKRISSPPCNLGLMDLCYMFYRLQAKRIVREELISFEVHFSINKPSIWNYFLDLAFAIFPNLKSINVGCPAYSFVHETLFKSNIKLHFESNCTRLTANNQTFDACNDYYPLFYPIFGDSSPRLMEIETSVFINGSYAKSEILQYFSTQKNLESVNISLVKCRLLNSLLLVHLLKECPNLRKLKITCENNEIILSYEQYKMLVHSRLESFCVDQFIKIYPQISFAEQMLNQTMHSLCMNTSNVGKNELVLIFRDFRCLKHLQLMNPTDTVLQTVFEHKADISSLILYDCSRCTDFGFLGHNTKINSDASFSIKRLQKLEKLVLTNPAGVYLDLTDSTRTINEFVFPNLRYLALINFEVSHNAFISIAENSPFLENVMINVLGRLGYYDTLFEFCRYLKHLRYLYPREAELSETDARLLFELCPSLRYIRHSHHQFSYNCLTKTISFEWAIPSYKPDTHFGCIF